MHNKFLVVLAPPLIINIFHISYLYLFEMLAFNIKMHTKKNVSCEIWCDDFMNLHLYFVSLTYSTCYKLTIMKLPCTDKIKHETVIIIKKKERILCDESRIDRFTTAEGFGLEVSGGFVVVNSGNGSSSGLCRRNEIRFLVVGINKWNYAH